MYPSTCQKREEDTLPGLCPGGLEALFCHLAQEFEDCTALCLYTDSYTGQRERLPSVGKAAAAEWQNGGALDAKPPQMDEVNQIKCHSMDGAVMYVYGPLFAVSSPIGVGELCL